jgi:hypothetical protein
VHKLASRAAAYHTRVSSASGLQNCPVTATPFHYALDSHATAGDCRHRSISFLRQRENFGADAMTYTHRESVFALDNRSL